MKTKLLVLTVLIVALAGIAAPVIAYSAGSGGSAGGTQDVNVSILMNNGSVNFGSFIVGTNSISPSHYSDVNGGFPEIAVYSNENSWQINVVGTKNLMSSTENYVLANPMQIATVSATGDSGSLTLHPTPAGLTTSSPGDNFVQGTSMNRANVSLSLSQVVIPKDKASTSYSMGITVTYNTAV